MRRRLLLLALLAGGLATAGGATLDNAAAWGHDAHVAATALARAQLADVRAPTALARARDGLGREHDTRRDVTTALGVALVLTLAGAGGSRASEPPASATHVHSRSGAPVRRHG